MVKNKLPTYLEDVPLRKRNDMNFQHDDESAHFYGLVTQHFNERFPIRWTGRGGRIIGRQIICLPMIFYHIIRIVKFLVLLIFFVFTHISFFRIKFYK